MRFIGLDPGLHKTGWGIIDLNGNHLSQVGDGTVVTDPGCPLAERLVQLQQSLTEVISHFKPDEAAIEETFVNVNPLSTLKLGQARGIVMVVPASQGIPVSEYTPNLVKKTIVGSGHARKEQIEMMVKTLLPGCIPDSSDSADALAVAICHIHHRKFKALKSRIEAMA